MNKPVIPVSRFRPFFGQAPTTGIPSRVFGGLRVISRSPIRSFIAGAVISLGILPEPTSPLSRALHLEIIQVRNDVRNGRVFTHSIPISAKKQTDSIAHLGFNVYRVRNDKGEGRVYSLSRTDSHFKLEPHIIIFRKPLSVARRWHPWFGQLPPVDIVQSDARKFGDFKVFQRFDNWQRPGRVIRTGPRLTGEVLVTTPKLSIGLRVDYRRHYQFRFRGIALKFGPARSGFFIAVEKHKEFTVVNNRSYQDLRKPRGQVVRLSKPRNSTFISYGPLNIYRGPDIAIFGQSYVWGPRRVDFIPPIEQKVPKILKIFRRQVIPYGGKSLKFGPAKEVLQIFEIYRGAKGLKVTSWRYNGNRNGKVLVITHFKRNPPPSGSINHGLIRLSEFRTTLSVKRENDGGKEDVFAADASGTVILFNKAFKIVESITVTPLQTSIETAIYDFNHATQNPTQFLVKLFDGAGVRINGFVSWKARGIL